MTDETVIRLSEVKMEGVGKRYGDHWVVKDVSLYIRPGEFYTLLGPSGCGKTTLLRMLAGFAQPDAGRILVDDEPIDPVPPWKRNVGMVFQNYALWPHMSVFENVAFGLRERRVSGHELERKVRAALELVGLTGFERRRPSQLSGGQQQRVALARTLVIQPRLLLLDEPLSNLDAQLRAQMRLELLRLHRDVGITTLYVTHDQAEALALSHEIAVMNEGRIVQIASPRAIYDRPRDRFVAEFIGASNFIDAKVMGQEGEHWRVRSQLGDILAMSEHRLLPGASVTLSLRPENVELSEQPFAGGTNFWRGTVDSKVFQGDFIDCQVRVNGIRLIARAHPSLGVAEGGVIHVHAAPDKCVVLAAPHASTSSA